MKVYLAVPLRRNRNKVLSKQIFEIVNGFGCEIVSKWIILDNPNPNLDLMGVYERDYNAIESCDILLAETSKPSTGLGMEIMLAWLLDKKIICVHKNKEKVSNFLLGMPEVSMLSYDNLDNLAVKLKRAIFKK